jgi:hypothetical protein
MLRIDENPATREQFFSAAGMNLMAVVDAMLRSSRTPAGERRHGGQRRAARRGEGALRRLPARGVRERGVRGRDREGVAERALRRDGGAPADEPGHTRPVQPTRCALDSHPRGETDAAAEDVRSRASREARALAEALGDAYQVAPVSRQALVALTLPDARGGVPAAPREPRGRARFLDLAAYYAVRYRDGRRRLGEIAAELCCLPERHPILDLTSPYK